MARANPIDKHDVRRRALVDSALRTLGELGYAKSSLREIANNSPFSHGVVHYYFQNKVELIVYCVKQYKAVCVTRYDGVVADSTTAAGLVVAFANKLCETIVDEAPMHRLWYDLRAQSMFEEYLREAAHQIDRSLEEMTWRVVTRYADLAGTETALSPLTVYGMLDGVFQQALLDYLSGQEQEALGILREQVSELMPLTLRSTPTDAPGVA
ncbi:TetR/AcrR family transcriptional regulator [Streptomyces sp. PSAA01]|uniref:TetR/AcrR family transcriptional regulator n=1 Tax=Streptomyces sp. PSAA01 TaxID=2912762 RepID=UPI001F33E976|nr:TetR/AcrR family transcriptional regulator [Streptomyces sp. PSAA01]MCG0284525.1 TetR/AcrR family transcriptional regulator [Streptomyces sp. PSAA01]